MARKGIIVTWLIEHLPRILAGTLVLGTAWAALAGIVVAVTPDVPGMRRRIVAGLVAVPLAALAFMFIVAVSYMLTALGGYAVTGDWRWWW